MASDWNVIAEIREAMNELKATAKQPYIHHTYDHQDEEGPYKELSLKAQLIVMLTNWQTSTLRTTRTLTTPESPFCLPAGVN